MLLNIALKMVTSKLPEILLKCDDHRDKTMNIFKQLSSDDLFTDVTLASEDHKTIAAHKAVLGYSSPHLFSLLQANLSEKTISLPVKHSYLQSMVEYMYLGETRVEVVDVKEFLHVANRFQIRGLWLGGKDEKYDKTKSNLQSNSGRETEMLREENVETQISPDKVKIEGYPLPKYTRFEENARNTTERGYMKYSCNQCVFRTTLKRNLKSHKETEHEKVIEKVQCEECGYIGNKNALKTHKLIHEGVKLQCDKCDYTTVKKFHLKQHVINMHDPVYFYCDQCAFRAKRMRYIKEHKAREHEGRLFMCDKCEFTAKFSARFEDHKRGVHDGIKYECDQCEYTCVFKGPMLQHKDVIHNKVRHACKMCDYKATRSSNLRAHERSVHMGEKRKHRE